MTHPPVFTLGQAGKEEHLIEPGTIPVIKSDQGWASDLPWPRTAYHLFTARFTTAKIGVRDLVSVIENSIIQLLDSYQIAARARQDAPGVYVGNSKIASLGLRVRKGCSYHGLSLIGTWIWSPTAELMFAVILGRR